MQVTEEIIAKAQDLEPYELEGDRFEFAKWVIEHYGAYEQIFLGPSSRKAGKELGYENKDVYDLWNECNECGAWHIHTVDKEHSCTGYKFTVAIVNISHPQINQMLKHFHPETLTGAGFIPPYEFKGDKAPNQALKSKFRKKLEPVKL